MCAQKGKGTNLNPAFEDAVFHVILNLDHTSVNFFGSPSPTFERTLNHRITFWLCWGRSFSDALSQSTTEARAQTHFQLQTCYRPQNRLCCGMKISVPKHGISLIHSPPVRWWICRTGNIRKHFTGWIMGEMLLDFPGVSQKWLSYNTENWISPTALNGVNEFGPLLYNCVIKIVNLLSARDNKKNTTSLCWGVLWIAL